MSVIDDLKRHEGFRSHPYHCSEGFLTIGYGLNLDDGISEQLAAKILEWTVQERESALSGMLSFWDNLTPARKDVFLNMAFNLGIPRFLGFKKMLIAAQDGDITGVCREMQDSKWARQVKGRADDLIERYRHG